MPDPEVVLALGGTALLIAVLASRVSARLGVPALLLFLLAGMVAGSDGPGGVQFADARLSQMIGIVALVLILFAGGLSTDWSVARPVIGYAACLGTFGVAITAGVVGAGAVWILGTSWQTGLLIGAIVSSTDAAAVFAVLRGSGVGLRGPIRNVLEVESGGNDPMAAFLTLALIDLQIDAGYPLWLLFLRLVLQIVMGCALGLSAGHLAAWIINRWRFDHEGLYPLVTLAIAVLAYACADVLGGSGFLATYVAGLTLASSQFLHRNSIERFHDAVAWLAQITMFLALGLLVFPSRLVGIAWTALAIVVILIVVARPLAVMLTLATSRFTFRERIFISWVGLRGAAPIVLATFPLVRRTPQAELIFDIVFFTVIASVLVQGATTPLAARLTAVGTVRPERHPFPIQSISADEAELHECVVESGSVADGASLVNLPIGDGTLVVLIDRENEFVVPRGSTTLHAGDRVLIISPGRGVRSLFQCRQDPTS